MPSARRTDSEVTLAQRRYNAACASKNAAFFPERWRALAKRLRAAADHVTGQSAVFLIDRANDCTARAKYLEARGACHAMAMRQAIPVLGEVA